MSALPDTLSREELLTLAPCDLLDDAVHRGDAAHDAIGLPETLAGAGALALGEQLRAAGVPVATAQDALADCVLALERVRDTVPAGAAALTRGQRAAVV